MCNLNSNQSRIEIEVKDIVLTPLSCASIINEIIKYLIYSKSQIPYPYSWLKGVVNRKRKSPEDEQPQEIANGNLTVERHYREVYNSYKSLEEIMEGIRKEFGKEKCSVSEVAILFGVNTCCVKEVFRIIIPKLASTHTESNHLAHSTKHQHKILRDIFFAQEWLDSMDITYPPTNMFVLIKKRLSEASFFKLSRNHSFSDRLNTVNITLNWNQSSITSSTTNMQLNCCNGLAVFQEEEDNNDKDDMLTNNARDCSRDNDKKSRTTTKEEQEEEETDNLNLMEEYWYEASASFKGFKNCFVNKVPASEMF